MKLSKLYSNKENFKNITFNLNGLNVIYADMKTKPSDSKSTHGIGKTKISELIDFLLLKQIKKEHFLFKINPETDSFYFGDYVFYLEILLNDGKYLTIKRSANFNDNTKIEFAINDNSVDDYHPPTNFDIKLNSFDQSKNVLKNLLKINLFNKDQYNYRNGLSYCLRTYPLDYSDVYKLNKFKGQDKDWKPFIFELLGFEGILLYEKYGLDKNINEIKTFIQKIKKEFSVDTVYRDDFIGKYQFLEKEIEKYSENIDKLNFYELENNKIQKGIEEIENNIAVYNSASYTLNYEINKLQQSINNGFSFDTKKVEKIFKECNIYFNEQLKKNYEDLLTFNYKITKERNKLIKEVLKEKNDELLNINNQLIDLNNQRETLLSFIQDTNTFRKFKEYQKELVKLQSQQQTLKEKIDKIDKLIEKENEIEAYKKSIESIVKQIKYLYQDTENNQKYKDIRYKFNSFYKDMMNEEARISWKINTNDNVDFPSPIIEDVKKNITAKDEGTTYKKILCIAFDLAIITSYLDKSYFKFIYHDELLSQQDNNVKIRLLNLIKKLCLQYDFQYIISVIKSDLPTDNDECIQFVNNGIILELNDKDENGTLFGFSF